jgi:hypothetical protein
MSDSVLAGDEFLTFPQAAAELPRRRGGAKTSTSTLWRWSKRGSRGVYLRVVRVGGNVYVPRSALVEFIEQRSAVGRGPQCPTPTTRSKRAMQQLDEMGM